VTKMQNKKLLSKQEIIELSMATWIMATVCFIIVQFYRPIFINAFSGALREVGVKNVNGFISWTDLGCTSGYVFPTMYRILHNLTIPYVMIFYVIIFILIFLLSKNKNLTKIAHYLFCYGCLLVHAIVSISYAISIYLPYDFIGSRLG